MLVIKADGGQEEFDPHKLVDSLKRAGAAPTSIAFIVGEVERWLAPGMRTADIYRKAFSLLRTSGEGVAARYSLKRAILDFGPSGFPFEAYVAALYRSFGYEAVIDTMVRGACVEHEVDVVLAKGNERTFVEAKFHNTPGFKTDLKVVLYVRSRIQDIAEAARKGEVVRGMVVTNTKFTSKALAYGECKELSLVGWDYPRVGNLHDCIERAGVYPITALTTLSKTEKNLLLKQKIVLCRSIAGNAEMLMQLGIKAERAHKAAQEAGGLCMPAVSGIQSPHGNKER